MRGLSLALVFLLPCAAWGQSIPSVAGGNGLYFGFIPSAAQWNSYFQAKADWIGVAPLTVGTLPPCDGE